MSIRHRMNERVRKEEGASIGEGEREKGEEERKRKLCTRKGRRRARKNNFVKTNR